MARLDGTRVLVVEDEDVLRAALLERLRAAGVVTNGAASGARAMDFVRSGTPLDAVLLDYKLPDACGLDILRRIKRLSPDTAVILMTGFSSVQVAVQAMKCGAADYAAKPVNTDDLLRMIHALIEPKEPSSRRANAPAITEKPAVALAPSAAAPSPEIIGASADTRALRALIARVVASLPPGARAEALNAREARTVTAASRGLVSRCLPAAVHEGSPQLFASATLA